MTYTTNPVFPSRYPSDVSAAVDAIDREISHLLVRNRITIARLLSRRSDLFRTLRSRTALP